MTALCKSYEKTTSKYLKTPRERTVFYRIAVFYIFALYVMPQYFGIPNPVFDLTLVRIGIIFVLTFIILDYDRSRDFVNMLAGDFMLKSLIPYLIVLAYTMVLRVDINALLNPLIELLEMYLLIYVIKDSFGVDRTLKIILGFIYLLIILGIVEAIMKVSPFSYLVTINGIYTGRYIRGGNYRIMSNCGHSLGYGLMLMTVLPFSGYDIENKTFNIYRRPLLLIGIIVNVFLTGSRATLGVAGAELALMFIFSDAKYLKKNILVTVSSIIVFLGITFCIQTTGPGQYILLQLTSLIDTLFDTQFSVKYGANLTQLNQSAAYRELLKEIFHVEWLNPILGIGRKRGFSGVVDGRVIRSIDSFYISEYVRYAYPGMIAYLFFLAVMGIRMLIAIWKTRSALVRMLFVGSVSYCIHLYIADSLQTLKYLYVLFALYVCCEKTPYIPEPKGRYFEKRKSRYVKK